MDTGASITCLSPELVQQVGLRSLGKREIGVPSGRAELNMYLVDLIIPFGDPTKAASTTFATFRAENVSVLEYRGDRTHYHGLLGRDVLDLGIFSLAGWDKKYYFSI